MPLQTPFCAAFNGYRCVLAAADPEGLDKALEEAKAALRRLARENYAIVYLTEGYAKDMAPEIARYKDALTPAVILIPGREGSLGIGMDNVKTAVERAVGADIL